MLDEQTAYYYNIIFSIILGIILVVLVNYFMGDPIVVVNKEN